MGPILVFEIINSQHFLFTDDFSKITGSSDLQISGSHKTIAVDYNDDKKPDLFIKKENGVTQHIFNNRSQVRINISSVKVGEYHSKEFSRQDGDKWKLYR